MSVSASVPGPQHKPAAFLSITLHAHLPYVINHGTWPHGIDWLHEAAAETYLPLLRTLRNLERDGLALHCNLNLSPILLEQLAHPVFKEEFPHYLERKIAAAREDEAYFNSCSEHHYAAVARHWQAFFTEALKQFGELDRDIVREFRGFHDRGMVEIITCCATHGYLPLLGTDESVRAQVRTGVATHQRHIGSHPRGIWIPECGYRPAGVWIQPVPNADGTPIPPPVHRIGIEQALAESGLDFFFVDTHLIEDEAPRHTPYQAVDLHDYRPNGHSPYADARRLYQPYSVGGSGAVEGAVAVFPRDPRTGLQVWSGDHGYPGDPNYLDFHKKRWPGGHRYWRVTGHRTAMAAKQPWMPNEAAERIKTHAAHFVHLVWGALQASLEGSSASEAPPVLCAPFDAELFGHWWYEGAQWLEAVARTVHEHPMGLQLITGSEYLANYPRAGTVNMHEGSWGAEGDNRVWLNPETSWTYERLYPAESFVRDLCTTADWSATELGQRIVKQLCRELLLLESSDWQFLITTGAARDYAEQRFHTHYNQFNQLKDLWRDFATYGSLLPEHEARLTAIEERDSIFHDIDPSLWASHSRPAAAAAANTLESVKII